MSGISLPSRRDALLRRGTRKARGGLVDLLLVALTLGALWGRTPVVELGSRAGAWVFGSEREQVALTHFFVTGPNADDVMELLEGVDATRIGAAGSGLPPDALPEPWRTASLLALAEVPPADKTPAEIAALPEQERLAALLDELYVGDPQAAIETYVVGAELVERASRRSRAAGDVDPQTYASHRAYLPAPSRKQADKFVQGALALATVLDMAWPIEGEHRISSPYGERVHPTLGTRRFHNGVDLAVAVGTPVRSSQSGRVAVAAEDDLNGKYLVVDHGYGVRSSYCHLSEHRVTKGASVERAQTVALSGNTGRSTGPHLHFTLRVGGETVDPMRLRDTALGDRTLDRGEEAGAPSGG